MFRSEIGIVRCLLYHISRFFVLFRFGFCFNLLFSFLFSSFLETEALAEPGAHLFDQANWPAIVLGFPCFCCLLMGLQGYTAVPGFSNRCWGFELMSSPHPPLAKVFLGNRQSGKNGPKRGCLIFSFTIYLSMSPASRWWRPNSVYNPAPATQ